MIIGDLHGGLKAAKADWLPGTTWIGFTPTGKGPSAIAKCEATIQRQFSGGWIIEYITETFHKPNSGFDNDPDYMRALEEHEKIKGRLVAVHNLRYSSRSLKEIIGAEEFTHLQDMWDQDGQRRRWSVAFPIVDSYKISGTPKAKDVLSHTSFRRLFARSSATLRALSDSEKLQLSKLEIEHQHSPNAYIAIEDEIVLAERSQISAESIRLIGEDLTDEALEGVLANQRSGVRKRAAWLADRFIRERKQQDSLHCDHCGLSPSNAFPDLAKNARTVLDVHHKHPISEGVRHTNLNDFSLLCPTCHRVEHIRMANRKAAS